MAARTLISSLGFQMTAALTGLALLFAAGGLYSVGAFQRQLVYDSVVNIAGRLELTAEQMHSQGMNYKQNAPRDYPTYYRDVRLYYQDLMAHVATFDQVVDTFMQGDFRGEMRGLLPWIQPQVGASVGAAIHRLEQVWAEYRRVLFEALGNDPEGPRLEYAAEHTIERHGALRDAAHALSMALADWAAAEHRRMTRGAMVIGLAAALVAVALLAVLRFKVVRPLRQTIEAFHRVAEGDFRHRVAETGTSEVQGLTHSFNQLSVRLDLLYRLIEGLQRGNDLDELVGFLSTDFRSLLGFDWIGVVQIDVQGSGARIENCWMDGERQPAEVERFRLQGALLEDALTAGAPLHVADAASMVAEHPGYEFLGHLVSLGMRDAVLLPLTPNSQTPTPAVLVFATRDAQRMDGAHRRFLGNIAQLLTQSFGRTARFAEQARLAAIGEFASAIAHEVRTPLSTVTMALDYLSAQPLDERAHKRVELGVQEAARIRRLLDDILLYAKPLRLDLRPADLVSTVAAFIDEDTAPDQRQAVRLEAAVARADVLMDPDRFQQVFANLTDNARHAAPEGSEILWRIDLTADGSRVLAAIHNAGEAIPPSLLPRITEPFLSTRANGTGLGLAIVRRLVEQHGGEIEVRSAPDAGTEVLLSLPRIGG
jgi:signal transduction histidine kinase